MRAVFILMVMFSHFGFGRIVPGLIGVTFFFVISGYLITSLLLDESANTGHIRLKNFYIRRGIRLYPAMLVMVAVGAFTYTALSGPLHINDILAAIFYWANYHFYPDVAGPRGITHPYLPMWSLAVEEHFYLLFPFLVVLLHKRLRTLLWTVLALILAVTFWRYYVAIDCHAFPNGGLCALPWRIVHGTDTRIDSILYGCLLAILMRTNPQPVMRRIYNSPVIFIMGLLAALASLAIRNPLFRDTLRFTLQPLSGFLLIGCVLYGDRFGRLASLLSHPVMVRIGRWSYSLYLWHYLVLSVVSGLITKALWTPILQGDILHGRASLKVVPILFLVSFLVAWLSYTGIEQPLIGLRRRFGSHTVREQNQNSGLNQNSEKALVPVTKTAPN